MTHDLQMRIQFDVVEIILLGLYFNGILLAHISLFMDLLLPVGCVVIEIHLRNETQRVGQQREYSPLFSNIAGWEIPYFYGHFTGKMIYKMVNFPASMGQNVC